MKPRRLFPLADPYSYREILKNIRVESTGEYRCPKKGEWFISGAIPEGYKAPNDLLTPYHIGILVEVEIKTVETFLRRVKE